MHMFYPGFTLVLNLEQGIDERKTTGPPLFVGWVESCLIFSDLLKLVWFSRSQQAKTILNFSGYKTPTYVINLPLPDISPRRGCIHGLIAVRPPFNIKPSLLP